MKCTNNIVIYLLWTPVVVVAHKTSIYSRCRLASTHHYDQTWERADDRQLEATAEIRRGGAFLYQVHGAPMKKGEDDTGRHKGGTC